MYQPDDPFVLLFDVSEFSSSEVVGVGCTSNFEKMMVYSDGNSVLESSEGGFGIFYTVAYISSDYTWAAGARTLIVYDSGGTWNTPFVFPTNLYKDIKDLLFFKSDDGWACGTLGYICRDIKGKWSLVTDTAIHGNFSIF